MDREIDLVEKVSSVTGLSDEEARHLLEAFQWNYDEAIRAHFDAEDEQPPLMTESSHVAAISQSNSATHVNNQTPAQRIITFDSLRTVHNDDQEEGQAFYVGGSETGGGGQQVLGPPKKGKGFPDPVSSPDEFVHNLFQAAKGQGAEVLDAEQYKHDEAKSKARQPFSGTGYRLGEDPNSPSVIEPGVSGTVSGIDGMSANEERRVVVKMWRDGFSLDDGPLRSYTDSSSQVFLDDIKAGRVPQELIRHASGGLINVLLEDHHHETWSAPPPPKVVPFSGKGTMLGHAVPPLVTKPTVQPDAQSTATFVAPQLNDSLPITQLQIRLPDGGRLLVRLNHSHAISDIRQAIISQRPSLAACPFTLMTAFPSKELTDEKQTIKDANLLNAALLLRLT